MPITEIVNRNDTAIDEKELERSGNGGASSENHSGKKLGNVIGRGIIVKDSFLRA